MSLPSTPNNLVPYGGQSIITSSENIFTWKSENQMAFFIEWSENIFDAEVNNTGWIISSIGEYKFSSGVFINTKIYKWKIKIRNTSGLESIFSDYSVFRGGNEVPLEITFPENEYDEILTIPTYQHSFNPISNSTQHSYRYQVCIGATWDDWDAMTANQQDTLTSDEVELYDAVPIWDSGTIISTATSIEQPAGHFIPSEYWYKVRCTIVDTLDNFYQSNLRSFYILLDSVPQTPTIIVTTDPANGRNIISITNPTPDPGQISTSYNRLYRKKLDGTWQLIQDNIVNGIGHDTTCRVGITEEYCASAVGTNSIEGGKSASAYGKCNLETYWFTNLTTNETLELYANITWGQMTSERKREEFLPIDEVYPKVSYSPQRFYRGSFQAMILKPENDISWPEYIVQIRNVLDAGNQILMRSPFGDQFKLDIYDLQITPSNTEKYREISFNMVEIAEVVPAGTYIYETVNTLLEYYWLIDPDTELGYPLYYNSEWGEIISEKQRVENIGLDNEMPTISYGNKKAIRSGFSGLIIQSDNKILAEEVMKLRELVDSKNKKMLKFRTLHGDEYFVDVYGFSFEIVNTIPESRKVSFEFIEVGEVG